MSQPISLRDVSRPFAERAAELAESVQAEHRQRIEDGHERFGWPLDAECANCGDTGKWPKSIHYCGCAAGTARRKRDDDDRMEGNRRAAWAAVEVPRRFDRYRLESSPNQEAVAAVRAWIADSPFESGRNLMLVGPVGTGKTGLAVGALRALHETTGFDLAFVGVPSLLDAIRPGGEDNGLFLRCQRVGCLTLDDLGVEKPSDWVRERLYVLVNARYEEQLPTIVTTNCDLVALSATLGERTVSRFAEDVAVVMVDGLDRRRA